MHYQRARPINESSIHSLCRSRTYCYERRYRLHRARDRQSNSYFKVTFCKWWRSRIGYTDSIILSSFKSCSLAILLHDPIEAIIRGYYVSSKSFVQGSPPFNCLYFRLGRWKCCQGLVKSKCITHYSLRLFQLRMVITNKYSPLWLIFVIG